MFVPNKIIKTILAKKLSKNSLNFLSWFAKTEIRLLAVALLTLLSQELVKRFARRAHLTQTPHEVG